MKLYSDTRFYMIEENILRFEIDKHFIKEKPEEGIICTPFIPTTQQIADVLTKGLLRQSFELQVRK